jgi:hypothetical protein
MPFTIRPHSRFTGPYASSYYTGFFLRWSLAYGLGIWLLMTIVALGSGPVHAEWVSVSLTKREGGYDVYADPDTIRRNGNLVKLWILYDYKTLQSSTGVAHLSDSIQLEANCTEKLQRSLAYTWWSGNMGNGNVVFSHSGEGNWIPIGPGTVGHTVWLFACGKR